MAQYGTTKMANGTWTAYLPCSDDPCELVWYWRSDRHKTRKAAMMAISDHRRMAARNPDDPRLAWPAPTLEAWRKAMAEATGDDGLTAWDDGDIAAAALEK